MGGREGRGRLQLIFDHSVYLAGFGGRWPWSYGTNLVGQCLLLMYRQERERPGERDGVSGAHNVYISWLATVH